MLQQATAQPLPGIGAPAQVAQVALELKGKPGMVIRAELFSPGLQIVDPDFFNQMTPCTT
jgi:hypothetical protein